LNLAEIFGVRFLSLSKKKTFQELKKIYQKSKNVLGKVGIYKTLDIGFGAHPACWKYYVNHLNDEFGSSPSSYKVGT
jgi:hypothetical protein